MYGEVATISIDLVAAGALGSALGAAILGHAKIIVGYLERKDSEHREAVKSIREDSKEMAKQFRDEVRDARAEYREMVNVVIERADEQDVEIGRMRTQMDGGNSTVSSGVRRKPPSSGG